MLPPVPPTVWDLDLLLADLAAQEWAQRPVTQTYLRDAVASLRGVQAPVFSVQADGAKPGASGAVNTAAFQATMNRIAAAGGGTFFIPPGNYTADPPAIVANCTVQGAGMGRTTITAATTNGCWTATDVSNFSLTDLTFVGLSANGANATNRALFVSAATVDVQDVTVARCWFRQCKSVDSIVRIAGNGDLVTPATKFIRNFRIYDCKVTEYYDTNPGSIGVAAHGIYLFGGIKGAWIQRNYVDGTSGKNGIISQSEANDVHIEDNIVQNCGVANAQFGYGITCYSSYTTVSVVDAFICRNTVISSVKAGIYLASVGKYVISHNILDTCDTLSSGLGNVGVGAIMINNSTNDAASGAGVVSDNTIIDPGFCAVYINNGSFQRAPCTVTGNSCKVTTAVARTGIVIAGRGSVVSGNSLRGFQTPIFLYNFADNITGDATISDNDIDSTGAPAFINGITFNSASFIINPLVIEGNRFKGCTTGINLIKLTDLILKGNFFAGATSPIVVNGVTRASIEGNVADGGTTGMSITLTPATVAARAIVKGNVMSFCTTPITYTENTGQIIFGLNDSGGVPGIGGNNGDTSIAFSPILRAYPWNSTKTANRTQTLNTVACVRGQEVSIIHNAAAPGAFTFAVVNGGGGGGTLYTIPISTRGTIDCVFDGTNWQFVRYTTY